ncbi:hypothetical protein ARAM_006340 [Aspergillus rambellii]|uniref:Uncharacterized protein n=1 Tax=Aspergillus rambellii TaxID=308745 RepID=A0A0F8X779_9EURO|nr:hypothetical protein ARAM_006340 [Aspergillus rambellii]
MPSPPPRQQPTPRVHSPSRMNLRHRGLTRSATCAEGSPVGQSQRRNSTLSDSVSEARNTIRSSTDDLFFPRVTNSSDHGQEDESHWHSAPLALALLPAVAGIFFQNGSAFVTDVTLLALAAVFLNWSVRLPWDWYRSARTTRQIDTVYDSPELSVELDQNDQRSSQGSQEDQTVADYKKDGRTASITTAASKELQTHELAALAACFIFPIIGTGLLHTIRSSLSRPSEGLVSNYNLTIFLLAAEIRPLSHLLKMVQARTLHLQRIVASSDEDGEKFDVSKIRDISKRLEELEAHVAETVAARLSPADPPPQQGEPAAAQEQEYIQSLVSQATADFRKGFQQDIDALNRAVRRYEKRTALTAYQSDSRLQVLETNVRDALSLAAAAQRSRGFFAVLLDWTSIVVFLPAQIALSLATLPLQIARGVLSKYKEFFLERGSSPPKPNTLNNNNDNTHSYNKGKWLQPRKPRSSSQKRPKRATIPEE